jgi:hypothetical protein
MESLSEHADPSIASLIEDAPKRRVRRNPRELVSDLQGRLVGKYLQALYRGYIGSPNHWLRTARTARHSPGWSRVLSVYNWNQLLCWRISNREAILYRVNDTGRVKFYTPGIPRSCRSATSNRVRLAEKSLFRRERLPTYPTLIEWGHAFWDPVKHREPEEPDRSQPMTRTNPRELWLNQPQLRKRIAQHMIYAVRDDQDVPKKVLRYMRYRWGWFIPNSARYPQIVADWLLRQWKARPRSLWLRDRTSYRKFLRANPYHG